MHCYIWKIVVRLAGSLSGKVLLIYTDLRILVFSVLFPLHKTVLQLSSLKGHLNLATDLVNYFASLIKNSSDLDVKGFIPLLNQIINKAPDADIWNAIYDLMRQPISTSKGTVSNKPETETPRIIDGLREKWNSP